MLIFYNVRKLLKIPLSMYTLITKPRILYTCLAWQYFPYIGDTVSQCTGNTVNKTSKSLCPVSNLARIGAQGEEQ